MSRSLALALTLLAFLAVLAARQWRAADAEPTPQAIDVVHAAAAPTRAASAGRPTPTPLPTRAPLPQGALVDYEVQPGDSVAAIAAHFHTTAEAVRAANPDLSLGLTTLQPGLHLQVPYYYMPTWGSPFKILPDPLFVFGPAVPENDPRAMEALVAQYPGWLKDYRGYAADQNRTGVEMIWHVARNYSVNPYLLLALLEYQAGALSRPDFPGPYMLGFQGYENKGLYLQLSAAANLLNHGYYAWRLGRIDQVVLRDGTEVRLDPWLNAATVALHVYFARQLPAHVYHQAVSPQGFFRTYATLFGDPWNPPPPPHIPGDLTQPRLLLPIPDNRGWSYSGGPHPAWGEELLPWSAIDFAPPDVRGCAVSRQWAVAVADGLVVRSGKDDGILVLDLDGDGDERTGWVIFHLHLTDRLPAGTWVRAGDPIGRPSCEGGHATGSHVHFARKYNGEWMPPDGPVPWLMEGWQVLVGPEPYAGWLRRGGQYIRACACGSPETIVRALRGGPVPPTPTPRPEAGP